MEKEAIVEKKCTTCGELKPLSEFYRNKNHKDGHEYSCKECRKEYTRSHPRTKEKEREYSHRRYVNHRDDVLESNRKWRDNNPEKFADSHRRYYEKNKKSISEKNKKLYEANREKVAEHGREYYKANTEAVLKRNRKWAEANREKMAEYGLLYKRKRFAEDVQFRLACALRSRLYSAVKNGLKGGSAVRDLGCSIDKLKSYLEARFKEGMTWDNWALDGWHIDHIVPLSSFDLTDREQLIKACHYTNLQPLWAEENLRKHNKTQ